MHFEVDSIVDIKWNSMAFDNLVLPEDYKRLILALAESQRTSSQVFDDVVSGKGKGIVILLNGPPGVGKTLTAESISEKMKAPMYSISAGDLGLDPGQVERRLLHVFKLAKAWNAVVLLDEADIFLEKRKLEDLLRNELVSSKWSSFLMLIVLLRILTTAISTIMVDIIPLSSNYFFLFFTVQSNT